MRSYEAARKSFGVLELFAWLMIVLGAIAAVGAFAAASSNPLVGIAASVPGVAIAALGFFGLAYVQTSRATVDSAEYAQQSLKLARDQYEISKQLLKYATGQPPVTYAGPTETPSSISYDTIAVAPEPTVPTTSPMEEQIAYAGHTITQQANTFLVDDRSFDTLIAAQQFIDHGQITAPATAELMPIGASDDETEHPEVLAVADTDPVPELTTVEETVGTVEDEPPLPRVSDLAVIKTHDHHGTKIDEVEGGFRMGGDLFASLDQAVRALTTPSARALLVVRSDP